MIKSAMTPTLIKFGQMTMRHFLQLLDNFFETRSQLALVGYNMGGQLTITLHKLILLYYMIPLG